MTLHFTHIRSISLTLTALLLASACTQNQVDRLRNLGEVPPMKEVENPEELRKPMSWPTPARRIKASYPETAGSLFNANTRDFFGDRRAREVGDILLVSIKIQDKAELDNKTESKRNGQDSLGAPAIFGLEGKLASLVSGETQPSSLLDITGQTSHTGEGVIEREEVIETEVAAVVRQVLPNGNLVIYGSQEVRVNHEVRQVTIEGVVRTPDITPDNKVDSSRIAEARISYGGKGLISDVQQPRLGSQIVDILSPF